MINSMNTLTEDLILVQPDDCSDDFLSALNNLIGKATELSINLQQLKLAEGSQPKKRRLTGYSSGSDDVRCIPTKIVTIDLDSDSDDSISWIVSDSSTSSETTRTIEVKKTKFRTKPCVVKLQRLRLSDTSAVHGLDQNFCTPNSKEDTLSENENKKLSWQVSLTDRTIVIDCN